MQPLCSLQHMRSWTKGLPLLSDTDYSTLNTNYHCSSCLDGGRLIKTIYNFRLEIRNILTVLIPKFFMYIKYFFNTDFYCLNAFLEPLRSALETISFVNINNQFYLLKFK